MEIEKLRDSVKEMYERENRSFHHARDEAIHERDRHVQLERDVQRKYDELLTEYVSTSFSIVHFHFDGLDIDSIKVLRKFESVNCNPM